MRARIEADAEARSRARAAVPPPPARPEPDAPHDEPKAAFRKAHPLDTTLVSAGVTQLDAAELARVDALATERGLTREAMLSELARTGVGRPENDATLNRGTPSPTDPMGPRWDPRVARRWAEKIEHARSTGVNVSHCLATVPCCGTVASTAGCSCTCDGCKRLTRLLADATREVLGAGK